MTIDQYVASLNSRECIQFCAARADVPQDAVAARLRDYASEVVVGLQLLAGRRLEGRVLEVGAGLGALGAWLVKQGVDIVLLEPGAGGFDHNRRLLDAVLVWAGTPDVPVLPIGAEALDPDMHGHFDTIFSVNVLEHIPALESAFDAMARVLAPDGLMRHNCPNYAVPYDPHFNVPLIPFAPARTSAIVRGLDRNEVWESLNFVTYSRIVRNCRRLGLAYAFDRGLLADAFRRMDRDAAFRARRSPMMQTIQPVLRRSGLLSLIESVPARWATPMIFSCWRAGDARV
jgi:SAM-dependent methyltransferase